MRVIQLDELFEFKNGVNADSAAYGSGTPFVNTKEVFSFDALRTEQIEGHVNLPNRDISIYHLEVGDVLFNRTSEIPNEIAYSVVFTGGAPAVFGGFIIRARPLADSLNLGYSVFCFNSSQFRKQAIRYSQGVVRGNIGQVDLGRIKIPLPPLPTQRRIAAILQTWDRAIALAEQQLDDLRSRKRGLLQLLLTGEKRLPGFEGAGEWSNVKIGQLLKEVKRPLIWDDEQAYDLVSIRRRSGGVFDRQTLFGHQIKTKTLKPIAEDDFLISKMQIVHGASAHVPQAFHGKMASGSYLTLRIRDPKRHSVRFLDYLSRQPAFYHQTYISSYGVHIEKMTFDFSSWKKLDLRFPCLKEQKAIVAVLDKEESGIRNAKNHLTALRTQKRGLLQRLLEGEVEVGEEFDYLLSDAT